MLTKLARAWANPRSVCLKVVMLSASGFRFERFGQPAVSGFKLCQSPQTFLTVHIKHDMPGHGVTDVG
jgi:hypothetical protein